MTNRIIECIGCGQNVGEIDGSVAARVTGNYVNALNSVVLSHFRSIKPPHHNYILKEKGIQVRRANVLTKGLDQPVVSRG